MVTEQSVHKQLKEIGFSQYGWGRSEIRELPHILLPDEQLFECVNGIYEGGFALLIGTNIRVLLIDKKPLNYLTVEDLRYDMINEIDYNHRLLGAYISITSGEKSMKFRSYNQPRLRKLITHVQHCMAEIKKSQQNHQEGQNQHLEQINQQLQAYLVAQHQHQEELYKHLKAQGAPPPPAEPIKPSPELNNYLFAQSLLAQHQEQIGEAAPTAASAPMPEPVAAAVPAPNPPQSTPESPEPARASLNDIYAAGVQEIFGRGQGSSPAADTSQQSSEAEVNPLRVAYSKLPFVLRSRKFGRRRSASAGAVPAAVLEPDSSA